MTRGQAGMLIAGVLWPNLAVWFYFVDLSAGLYVVCKLVQFALPFVAITVFASPRDWTLQITRRETLAGALSGLAIAVGLILLFEFALKDLSFIAEAKLRIADKLSQLNLTQAAPYLALALGVSLVHSFLEELYWRGWIHETLQRRSPLTLNQARWLSSLAFTGHHVVVISQYAPNENRWALTALFSAFVFVGGWIWAWWLDRERRGLKPSNLWAVWLSHIAADLAIFVIGWRLLQLA
ncbi:MAG TPA: CPBP family intramembrane metalloprotease [Pseudobdellovibrionaceae bacterium]|nr:CPBP family intramembrane metalloprotease [Pseudobdellovibrionaceae bacterium]